MEDKVLEQVVEKLEYTFVKDVLVKPLAVIMLKKEVEEPVATGEKDENGYEKYDTKKVTTEVASEFRTGIVLSVPTLGDSGVSVGDTIAYPAKFAKDFDLFKDSQLVKPYDIVAIHK